MKPTANERKRTLGVKNQNVFAFTLLLSQAHAWTANT